MLSRYKILNKLGSGGIGVVYLAEDVTLKRKVALKFLTEESFSNEQMRIRFLREARTAASLNHSNICTIYETSEVQPGEEQTLESGEQLSSGTPFIAMELIEGQTLSSMIQRSCGLPFDELIDIAIQVAEGLAAAHSNGIVHRDLKPHNVMIDKEGRAKILDFGLAKPMAKPEPGDDLATAGETLSAELTREGRVLGTVAYMSPEQAQGKSTDSRSDIFSFGIMLYEMATGKRPFRGESPTSILAKILETEPEPLDEIRRDLPLELARIVRRCLRKKPDDRYNDTRDLVVALKDLKQDTTSGKVQVIESTLERKCRAKKWAIGITAGLIIIASIIILSLWKFPKGKKPFISPAHRQITFDGHSQLPSISPDGQYVAYATDLEEGQEGQKVLVQDLAGGKPIQILGMKRVSKIHWSPNGTELLIGGNDYNDIHKTILIPRFGGEQRFIRFIQRYCVWSPDGSQLAGSYSASKKIFFIDVATGQETSLSLPDAFTLFRGIHWSPRGNLLLFSTEDEQGRSAIWSITRDGKKYNKVFEKDVEFSSPRFSHSGEYIYFLMQGESMIKDLWKIKVDPESGERASDPIQILTGIPFGDKFSLSSDGKKMAYTRSSELKHLYLVKVEKKGGKPTVDTQQLTSGALLARHPSISPDGKLLAFTLGDYKKSNIYTMPLEAGQMKQLTFFDSYNAFPVFSPDGNQIAFGSMEGGTCRVWTVNTQGGTPKSYSQTLVSANSTELAWTPYNRILYHRPGNRTFHILDPISEEETPLVDESLGWIFTPKISPDGDRVAVYWNRRKDVDGDWGVWVLGLKDSSQKYIYKDWSPPIGWSSDGNWIYAIKMDSTPQKILRFPARGGDPETVFNLPFENAEDYCAMISDCSKFVFCSYETQSDVWIVENFHPDLN